MVAFIAQVRGYLCTCEVYKILGSNFDQPHGAGVQCPETTFYCIYLFVLGTQQLISTASTLNQLTFLQEITTV
jgi:hypothetical protein